MFLKTLVLKGFKSFADTATLELGPGVTVVVGPNGSGKSNVVDAIGWVLGSQAPSAIRSQRMDDVIFAGTSDRPALGRAEVLLTIDNSDGQLPLDFSEVTIRRTLFREGDSEYALNGVPCRLLDIQELLSDSGVGRQQHVIVSQGQIDAVLSARPEERRLVIEEAAGVLKFRKRKEKAERRLAGTEQNMARIRDLLREVRRQLRPLAQQADAARRHGSLVAELATLRVHIAGRELLALRGRLEALAVEGRELTAEERRLREELATLDDEVARVEQQLSALGADDLGDSVAEFEGLRERARGLRAVLTERRRSLQRDRDAVDDRDVVALLEAEAVLAREQLQQVDDDARALQDRADEVAEAEAQLAVDRQQLERAAVPRRGDEVARATEARADRSALLAGMERTRQELDRVGVRLQSLDERGASLVSQEQQLQLRFEEIAVQEPSTADRLAAAREALGRVEAHHRDAEEHHRVAETDLERWSARAEALRLALDDARADAGIEQLDGLDGVLGTLLDLVEVDDGYNVAFEAAAADALGAVVVSSPEVARDAIARFRSEDRPGAVIALGSGVRTVQPPVVGVPLRSKIRSHEPGVDAVLDRLFGTSVVVDGTWAEAVDVALRFPDAVVVTAGGDRFSASGWRVGHRGAGATGAALAEADERTSVARVTVEEAKRAHDDLGAELTEARAGVETLTAAHRRAQASHTKTGDDLQRVAASREDIEREAEGLRSHLDELRQRMASDQNQLTAIEAELPELEAVAARVTQVASELEGARRQYEQRSAAVVAKRTDLEVQTAELAERRRQLTGRLGDIDERLARSSEHRAEIEAARRQLDDQLLAVDRLDHVLADRHSVIEGHLEQLHAQRKQLSQEAQARAAELEALRERRRTRETDLEGARERQQRHELERAEVEMRRDAAVEALRRDHQCEPATAVDTACPELPEGTSPEARVRELERELRLMGPINPLALEEHDALDERHTFLQEQLDDIKRSRRELMKVIRAIDAEIVSVFSAAFADVSGNFEALFTSLFPGGRGRLKLTQPDDLLVTGIEVEAKPSGKNVQKLSLLSGGERSLTALAFLFAVFRSRPSPFYVMDEVEAALDDVNLHRFLELVHEFRSEAQLVIVSHQKRTMEAGDVLYGVSMQPGGSSKVISERVADLDLRSA